MNLKFFLKDYFLNGIANSFLLSNRIRKLLYNSAGYDIKGSICAECFCGYGKGRLSVGNGSSINYKCFFDLGADVIIGDNCNVSYQVTFVNSSHEIGNSTKRAKGGFAESIIIEDGCWIGANVTIMPGVRVGKGCIIGTGSLILHDCERDGLYVGHPAKRVKDLR